MVAMRAKAERASAMTVIIISTLSPGLGVVGSAVWFTSVGSSGLGSESRRLLRVETGVAKQHVADTRIVCSNSNVGDMVRWDKFGEGR